MTNAHKYHGQDALHGLLIRIRDLNLTLRSIEQTAPDQANKK
jgi:hypothetical protein